MACQNCGMGHAPDDAAACIEGHGNDPILCYVSEPWAYFTTQALADQWGDDWNDAPYEHNAGTPYGDHKTSESQEPRWRIYKIAWEGPFETPSSWGFNSPYSVETINRGAVPWIQTDRYERERERVRIYAGVTMDEFCELIRRGGGTVYLPGEAPISNRVVD